ncbi:MAG: hypothetical protein R8G33_06910 [Gammaproteobacteria bacterium]|nr:hypothetical protein [Gammaproteobacteria bacterium]
MHKIKLTPFETEVLESILWQLKGFKEGFVTDRVTRRILRATLRRLKPCLIGHSVNAVNSKQVEIDHAVPLKEVVAMLMELDNLSSVELIDLLNKYLVSVQLTPREHRVVLKDHGVSSSMPDNWDGDDALARYKKAGIEITKTYP